MIQIDHLSKVFPPNHRVVDDVSLEVKTGEVFGFLGPNGAGKTTTIKILTTLIHPSSGTAVVAGHDVVEDPLSVRMSFGYVGQQSGVDPALTVKENLRLQGRLYHLPNKRLQERIQLLIKLFDLEGREGQWVGVLSGGLKRRLDIATSLIHEPKLLFLDEPTLGLDPKSRLDLWTYIRRLNEEEGMTLFLTTHHLEEVDQLAHRVGILDAGRLRIVGTPDALKDSLGADAIHLSFRNPLPEERLSPFRKNPWFKDIIQKGPELRLYLEEGRAALPKVIQWLDEQGLAPASVLLSRPTFDDVYLKYTGKNWATADEKKEEGWGDWGGGSGKWKNKWNKDGGEPEGDWAKTWNQDPAQSASNTQGGDGSDWEAKWKNDESTSGGTGEGDAPAPHSPQGQWKTQDPQDPDDKTQVQTKVEKETPQWGKEWQGGGKSGDWNPPTQKNGKSEKG